MPFVLVAAGLLLVIAGARNTQGQLFTLLKGDFTGNNSFFWWALSIVGIGAVGYIKDLRVVANSFLALVLIVLILANKGVFAKFTQSLQAGTQDGSNQSVFQDSSGQTVGLGQAFSNIMGKLQAIGGNPNG